MFANVILRDLIRQGQLLRFEVPISDQPGALASLATIVAAEGANIVDVSHERLSLALNPKGAVLDIILELENAGHRDRLLAKLDVAGFRATPRALS